MTQPNPAESVDQVSSSPTHAAFDAMDAQETGFERGPGGND